MYAPGTDVSENSRVDRSAEASKGSSPSIRSYPCVILKTIAAATLRTGMVMASHRDKYCIPTNVMQKVFRTLE